MRLYISIAVVLLAGCGPISPCDGFRHAYEERRWAIDQCQVDGKCKLRMEDFKRLKHYERKTREHCER